MVRAAPCGLACVGDRFRVAHESARITHYRSNSRTTAAALANAAEQTVWKGRSAPSLSSIPRTPAEVLAYAVRCASAPDATTALEAALCHAGDITATGAITGTLFGVQHGALALPGALFARLELADVVREAADDLILGYDPSPAWSARYPGC